MQSSMQRPHTRLRLHFGLHSAIRKEARQFRLMIDGNTIFVAAVFAFAGLTKGVIGLGLPTISMGLLAVVMAPGEAAAILVLPSFVTNVWQMFAGRSLVTVVRRLWPMMLAVCLGTWAGAGLITGTFARYGTAFLGTGLLLYAVTGLASVRFVASKEYERWLGPFVGAATGLITAATGVFVIPAVPYLQAIGLEKEDLVQALGLSFTVSTVALTINLALAGVLNAAIAGPAIGALAMACAGMWFVQALRLWMQPAAFRRCFFVGLLVLGIYLVVPFRDLRLRLRNVAFGLCMDGARGTRRI
jgi:uncharacterized membrane protein YfcA